MVYSVSSSFVDEASKSFCRPIRYFFIGGSDYTERVTKWPRFKREAQDFKVSNLNMTMANHDGGLNDFYQNNYKFVTSAYVQLGFDYGGSEEVITLFTGSFSRVKYTKNQTSVYLRDKLYDFQNILIGSTDSPVDITSVLPSDLFWILTTCYGTLSDSEAIGNPDIDWSSFQDWAEVFSENQVFVSANFQGVKISEAMSALAKMTDSAIYAEGNGKIYTQRYTVTNTEFTVIGEDKTVSVELDVLQKQLINKQYVGFDYSVESKYWQQTVLSQNSASVNSYGTYEDYLQNKNIWYVDSVSAFNVAQRLTTRYREPPKLWTVKSILAGVHMQMGETIKFANDFYNQTSETGTRITGIEFDTHEGLITFTLDTSVQFNAFTLDVDSLDSTDRFLL